MTTSARRLITIAALGAVMAVPAVGWADGGLFFGGGFGGYHGGFWGPHGGVFVGGPSSAYPSWGYDYDYGRPSWDIWGQPGGGGWWPGWRGWRGGEITPGYVGDSWTGTRSYLRSPYPEPGSALEIAPPALDKPLEFRGRLIAPRVLEVTWPGSQEPVSQVLFELLGATGQVIDQRYEQEPPYKGLLNVTSEVRYVRMTVTYKDGLERSVKVPFQPPQAP